MNQEIQARKSYFVKAKFENILSELYFIEEKANQIRSAIRQAQRGGNFDPSYAFEKEGKMKSAIESIHFDITAIRNEFLGLVYCDLCKEMITEDPMSKEHLLAHGIETN